MAKTNASHPDADLFPHATGPAEALVKVRYNSRDCPFRLSPICIATTADL